MVANLNTNQFDGLASELPLVPLVRLDDIGFNGMDLRLDAHVTFGDGLLNHLTLVLALDTITREKDDDDK